LSAIGLHYILKGEGVEKDTPEGRRGGAGQKARGIAATPATHLTEVSSLQHLHLIALNIKDPQVHNLIS
jgi:hypothetical protein